MFLTFFRHSQAHRGRTFARVGALALLALAGTTASAQTMKPGLWEFTSKMQSSNGEIEKAMAQMQQQMASLPPEQRKRMQDMMAKQNVSIGAGGGTTSKVCMTKEMVDRNEVMAREGECKTTNVAKQGNVVKTSYVCTEPKMSGESEVTMQDPENYTMKVVMDTVQQGKPERMKMDSSGKWLGADCGAVKPITPRAAAK